MYFEKKNCNLYFEKNRKYAFLFLNVIKLIV